MTVAVDTGTAGQSGTGELSPEPPPVLEPPPEPEKPFDPFPPPPPEIDAGTEEPELEPEDGVDTAVGAVAGVLALCPRLAMSLEGTLAGWIVAVPFESAESVTSADGSGVGFSRRYRVVVGASFVIANSVGAASLGISVGIVVGTTLFAVATMPTATVVTVAFAEAKIPGKLPMPAAGASRLGTNTS